MLTFRPRRVASADDPPADKRAKLDRTLTQPAAAADELVAVVLGTCAGLAAATRPGPVKDGVAAIARRLSEPLRVAVAGRVSSGKSTLVNALLGVPVAPTAAGECTRVVTWYRYGDHDEAAAVLDDGSRHPIALGPRRTLPDDLGVPWEKVRCIEARLYCAALADVTVVDTPGLSSLTEGTSARTLELLATRSRHAARQADALIHVVTGQVREDDQRTVADFTQHVGDAHVSVANSLVVLNKIDKLAEPGEDAWTVAAALQARVRSELGSRVTAVVPMIGLLAATSRCGLLDEQMARQLHELSELSPSGLRTALRGYAAGGTDGTAGRLLRRLDSYGIGECVDALRAGERGAPGLLRTCEERSGVGALHRALFGTFAARAGVLRADSALAALRELTEVADIPEQRLLAAALREIADAVAFLPDGADLRVLGLERRASSGELTVPAERLAELRRWVAGTDPATRVGLQPGAPVQEVRAAAIALAGRWRSVANDPCSDADGRSAAHVMTAAFAGLVGQVT